MAFRLEYKRFPAPNGPLEVAPIPWDTEIYGFPFFDLKCAGLTVEDLERHLATWLATLPDTSNCLVVTRVGGRSAAVDRVLCATGFYPSETSLELSFRIDELEPFVTARAAGTVLRLATVAELEVLQRIAAAGISEDRFHYDPHLPRKISSQRYAIWIANAFRDGEPVFALCATATGSVIGFSHVRETSPTTIDLRLHGLLPQYQGSGAGLVMLEAMLLHFRERGFKIATTRTSANNLESLNVLTAYGFFFTDSQRIWHWFRPASPA